MKSALITGCSGQDGSFMAEYLLSLGYRVVGTVRKNPGSSPWLAGLLDRMEFVYCDMRDAVAIEAAVNKSWPDEVYNFAAYDGIPLSWVFPEEFMDVIYGGLSRLLTSVTRARPEARIYQASSAAMFGDYNGPCDDHTPPNPNSPYAVAKHAAHELAQIKRASGVHISCGICVNHESERRSQDRASKKISTAVAGWALGSEAPLMFGRTDAKRDWGFAGDFVKAFHAMLQQDVPDNYVIGTGEAHSVGAFIKACCTAAGLGAVPEHLIKTDSRFLRSNDMRVIVANPEKAATVLGWRAETDYQHLAERMVHSEMERMRRSDAQIERSTAA